MCWSIPQACGRYLRLWILLCLCLAPAAAQVPTSQPEDWRQDLQFLATNLPQVHKNLFFQMSRASFDAAVAQLSSDIPTLSDTQIILGLARIAAMSGDSHTGLTLKQPGIAFRSYPIRVQWFADGLFVTQAAPRYRSALGLKVVEVGNTPLTAVFSEVARLISHENDAWLKVISRDYLLMPEVLHGLGFVSNMEKGRFVLEDPAGRRSIVDLEPLPAGTGISWISALEERGLPPHLHQKDSALPYWAQYLEDTAALYVKYNSCRSAEELPFESFAQMLLVFMDSNPVRRLILDLRNNTGGNSSVILPLFLGLEDRINRGRFDPAGLFGIIGPETFSSGMLNAIQLAQGGTLVGEPTGGKPNSYGEVWGFLLPRSNLLVTYSTKFFQASPVDTPSLEPHVAALTSAAQFLQGRDPALESILPETRELTTLFPYALYRNGGLTRTTINREGSLETGFALVEAGVGTPLPAGLAIFGYQQQGVTVTEATVPASPPVRAGRLFAEVRPASKTGLAFANPNEGDSEISFYFTDTQGNDYGHGRMNLPGRNQVAKFLDQEPFLGSSGFIGALTWESTLPVSATALTGVVNERSEFLITTLPDSRPGAISSGLRVLSHFADGDGWSTQIVLLNPTDGRLNGTLRFFSQGSATASGQPLQVTLDGETSTSFSYDLAPRSSRRLTTAGLQSQVQVGSIWITPAAGDPAPAASGVYTARAGGVTVSMAGAPALAPGSSFRIFAEASGDFLSGSPGFLMTGIAMANAADQSIAVSVELRQMNGRLALPAASLTLPPNGQISLFLNQIPGLQQLQTPFQGVLRISSPSPSLTVVGLRARYNERGNFLVAATPPLEESQTGTVLVFPHMAGGGGYSTQTVLLGAPPGQISAGSIRCFSPTGQPWWLAWR